MTGCPIEQPSFSSLYEALSALDLARVARRSRCDVEDIRQEARVICWEIATNQSTFDPEKGSAKQFIMGKLWHMADHENFQGHQEANETTDFLAENLLDQSPSPLEMLLAKESERLGQRTLDTNKLTANMTLEQYMWFSGLPYTAIEKVTGISRSTAFRAIKKAFKPEEIK